MLEDLEQPCWQRRAQMIRFPAVYRGVGPCSIYIPQNILLTKYMKAYIAIVVKAATLHNPKLDPSKLLEGPYPKDGLPITWGLSCMLRIYHCP